MSSIIKKGKKIICARALFGGVATASLILLSGCSLRPDDKYVQPYTTEVSNWRQYLGVAVAVQFLLLAWVFWTTHRRARMSRLFLAIIFLPLMWTKVGEWLYRLGVWVLEWETYGRLVAIFLSFVGGITGTSNVFSYVLGASIFNDTEFLLYWVVPGVVASYVAALAYLLRGRKYSGSKKS